MIEWHELSQTLLSALKVSSTKIIGQCHSYEELPRYLPVHLMLWCISSGGACFIFIIISRLLLSFALHSIHYLSFDVICFVNSHPKRVRLLVQYLPTYVLEIVDRNRYGLICLLVHTERNSPYKTEENAVSGAKFEELHRSISVLQRRKSYICWRHVDEKINVKELTPRKFPAEAKLLVRCCPKKLTAASESRRQIEDVVFFSLFFFCSFES
jgi:hypothetical protein